MEKHDGERLMERVKVLIYHRVLTDEAACRDQEDMCVHTSTFRNQLELLERWGFTTITFRDYELYLRGELNLPRRPVIITFDDGYVDVYENAFPLLQLFGMTAVVFAIGDQKTSINVWDQRTGYPQASLMTTGQLLELHAFGFEIGSHSLSHAALPEIPADDARDEILRSRMLLEIALNAPVRSFAYPYGLASEGVKRMVSEAGYSVGCGVYTGPARFWEDPFDIRRILIRNSMNAFDFGVRVLAPYEYFASFWWKMRRLSNSLTKHALKPTRYYQV